MISLLLKLSFLKRLVLLAAAGFANAPPAFIATLSAIWPRHARGWASSPSSAAVHQSQSPRIQHPPCLSPWLASSWAEWVWRCIWFSLALEGRQPRRRHPPP